MTQFNAILSPLRLGSITIKNRVGMSALTRNRSRATYPSDLVKEYYVQRVRGGAGLIVAEGILIVRQGTEWPHAPGLWDDEHVKQWKNITDAVHAEGGHMYAQLWHLGRVSHPDAPEQILAGTPVYAPSAISARGGKFRHLAGQPGYVTPTAVEDPTIIIEQFRHAAENAKKAGFDGVELHGANGYLIAQFLDSTSNQRTDKWGGSIENRARFGLEVLKALSEVFPGNVSVKLSPAGGYNDLGMPLQETLDTFRYFITEADKLNLSYITIMRYMSSMDGEYDGKKRATVHDTLESYGPYIKNAKRFVNGGLSVEEGNQLVEAGKIDGIFIGFNWITHPDLVNRVVKGIPLSNIPDIPHLQTGKTADEWSVGYTDYPTAT